MTTLRRILKYTPAVVLGLLVAVWAVSLVVMFGATKTYAGHQWSFGIGNATFGGGVQEIQPTLPEGWAWFPCSPPHEPRQVLGTLQLYSQLPGGGWCRGANLPFPLLITLVALLAIGPFVSFRFRLWHYLAYTALVAVELAYYLRWQG